MSSYSRGNFAKDVIAGLTVGIMHIPQGMAYGLLANLPPIYGLYTSFFPTIIYFFLGTSKHISIGTFAVVSLMMGVAVNKADCERFASNVTNGNLTIDTTTTPFTDDSNDEVLRCQVGVAITTTFAVGIIHLIFAVFQVGIVSEYLPTSVTRSLTFGAALHIFTSQVRHIFGYSLGNSSGVLKLIRRYIVFFTNLHKINWASVVVSVVCITIIYLVQRFINPKVKAKIKMPIPIDFIVLVLGTAISYGFKFSSPDVFNIAVVGNIPRGFPTPRAPAFAQLGEFFPDAIAIAVISYIVSYSMAKLFADMEKYQIDSNQELIAHACLNLGSSFLNCYVASASLSRSYVQYMAGGKSQVTGLVSSLLLLVVIMAVGPLFHDLPKCILAAIIVVNLKGIFLQILDLKYHFRVSVYDGFIFVVTVLAILLTDVDIGLAIGVAFTFFSVVVRSQRPKVGTLALIKDTECYVEAKRFENAEEVDRIKVLFMDTSLYYVNQNHFLSRVKSSNFIEQQNDPQRNNRHLCCVKTTKQDDANKRVPTLPFDDVILDCSHMSFIDADGISTINKMVLNYEVVEVRVSLACCSDKIYKMLKKAMELEKLMQVSIFLSVHDAVTSIIKARQNKRGTESNI